MNPRIGLLVARGWRNGTSAYRVRTFGLACPLPGVELGWLAKCVHGPRPRPGFFHEHQSPGSGDVELRSRGGSESPRCRRVESESPCILLEAHPLDMEANKLGNEACPHFAAGADGEFATPRESRLRWNSKQSRIS